MFSGSYPQAKTAKRAAPPMGQRFGRYLGDAEKIKAAAEAVKNQTKAIWDCAG